MLNYVNNMNKGTKKFDELVIEDHLGNKTLLPYYIIKGSKEGKTILVTSGVHGTEYPGIAANIKLYNEINPEDVTGTIIGCPMCNYEAFTQRSMFINPLDKKNLNDVFPGDPNGTITEKIADILINKFAKNADYHVDMHSGDSIEYLHPYVFYHKSNNEQINTISKEMAKIYGVQYIAPTETAGNGATDKGNFYASTSELNIPSIQPEVGGLGLVEKETKEIHYNGIINVLSYLKFITIPENNKNNKIDEIESFYRVISEHDGIFNVAVKPGQLVKKGEYLGNITNYNGEKILQEFYAEKDSVILWVMAALSTHNKDKLIAIGNLE